MKDMIKIVLVEDDESDAALLKEYISGCAKELSKVFSVSWYKCGHDFLAEYKSDADIIFMDIELPDIDGIECSRRLRKTDTKAVLIFVTNMAQYAIKGYGVAALDYCLKPLQYYVFLMKMKRALQCVERNEDKHIIINTGNGKKRVSVNSIEFVEITNHSLRWHIAGGEVTFGQSGEIFRTNIILPCAA